MINIFQENYDTRLKSWYDLRLSLQSADTQTICVEVDNWWQKAPIVNRYLCKHPLEDWPTPWELLSDNLYCEIARGLGMVYTLFLLGKTDIDFVKATDYNNESVVLILVERAKYVMNHWPGSVLNSSLNSFTITDSIDIPTLLKKIGQ